MSWLFHSDFTKQRSSATFAVCGSSSLSHAPDWPCCEGDGLGGLDVPRVVVHPQAGVPADEVELQLPVDEEQAEALSPRRVEERARDDGAGGRLRLDPGREGHRPPAAVDAVVGILQVGVERLGAAPPRRAAVHVAPTVEAARLRRSQRKVGRQAVAGRPDDGVGVAERRLPGALRLVDLRPQLRELRLGRRDAIVDRPQLLLLFRRRRVDQGRRVAGLLPDPRLRDAVEVGEELVELLLLDRVELVVVAAGAAHRQPQPHGARRRDAVDDVLDEELLRDDAHLGVHAVVAVEAGGDPLIERRVRRRSPASCSIVKRRTAGCG